MVRAVIAMFITANAWALQAPSFEGDTLQGTRTSLKKSLKENRALLVSFWATWCVPCIEELKHVKKHLKDHPNYPLDVLTINVDTSDTQGGVASTMRMYGLDFPVLMDPEHAVFNQYHASKTLPFSAVVDWTGKIVRTFTGYQESMFNDISEVLKIKKQPAKG